MNWRRVPSGSVIAPLLGADQDAVVQEPGHVHPSHTPAGPNAVRTVGNWETTVWLTAA
ncbi:hypothetical protein [Streptomyces sp. NPDC059371]|uniref:hypothetical protein n=1 Tax=Streptomyces sp. NPDC059371 TaxID=3346812 RepID=UPI0036A88BDB